MLNIITSQKEREAMFWRQQVPVGEIASGIQWAKAAMEERNVGVRQSYSFAIPKADYADILKICKNKPENVHVLLVTVMSLLFFKYHSNRLVVVFTPAYKHSAGADWLNTVIPVITDVQEQYSFFSYWHWYSRI